jgi:predicted phosphodiesterase
MSESAWRLPDEGACIAVLANCHVTKGGLAFPEALFPRLQDADLIVTLGGMGDRSALNRLEEIAPVLGVAAPGDPDDIRTRRSVLVLAGEGYRVGCVSDAVAAGLARENDPLVVFTDAEAVAERLFGGPVDVLLHAGAARADEIGFGTGSALNPGSATAPLDGERPSFIRLKVTRAGCYGQVIWSA